MNMRVATHIAFFTHIDPTPQAESQWLTSVLSQVHRGFDRESLDSAPHLNHQAIGAGIQYERPVHVTSALAQVLNMGMRAFNLDRLSFSIGKQQRCCNWLAGFVIEDGPFQPVDTRASVGYRQKNCEQRGDHRPAIGTLGHIWSTLALWTIVAPTRLPTDVEVDVNRCELRRLGKPVSDFVGVQAPGGILASQRPSGQPEPSGVGSGASTIPGERARRRVPLRRLKRCSFRAADHADYGWT